MSGGGPVQRTGADILHDCADFTRDVALNYVKRGYHLLCRHAITLFLLPVGGTLVVRFSASRIERYALFDVQSMQQSRLKPFAWYPALSNGKIEWCPRQLELGNMAKSGELMEIWDVAAKTNLQFNMVLHPFWPCNFAHQTALGSCHLSLLRHDKDCVPCRSLS